MATTVRLADGTRIRCLRRYEALALDSHVDGYFSHGISVAPGAVIFDVGANIGVFALRALERCDGDATVLAFEPIPAIHEVLAANVAGLSTVHAVPQAIGERPGRASLTYFPNGPALSGAHPELWRDAPHQLDAAVRGGARRGPTRWGRWLPGPLLRRIGRRLVRDGVQVSCEITTVSEALGEHRLDRIDLLKIDVEGGELAALRGVKAADWPRIRQVVVEVHDTDDRLRTVVDLLRGHGLTELWVEQEPGFEGTWMHNVFASRPAHPG